MSTPERPRVRSMTGFARVRKPCGSGEVIVSLKSVNHRGLDLHFHTPAEAEPHENTLRGLLKAAIARGHVDVRIQLDRPGKAKTLAIDRELLGAYLTTFREVAAEYGLDSQPDLNTAMRLPDVVIEQSQEGAPELEAALVEATRQALRELNDFREREAAGLLDTIQSHVAQIRQSVARMKQIRETALPAFQTRLQDRLNELLKGSSLEPGRLVSEAAILADRSDIAEEVARLEIHAAQVEALLGSPPEVGKKLDFLVQEMNRETNTILSKTNGLGELGLGITDLGLATKADLEKIREQASNLE